MKLAARVMDMTYIHGAFRIARKSYTTFQTAILELEHEGIVGLGEAHPSLYYDGEDCARVLKTVKAANRLLGKDPFQIEDITARLAREFPREHAAAAGIDIALHDLVGKLMGVPLYRLLGLNPAKTPVTSYTIGIDEPEAMARIAAAERKRFKVLKIKVGTKRDEEILKAIRGVTDLPLRIDANIGWTKEEAVRNLEKLAKYNIEFVEQPIAPGDNKALKWVRDRSPVPVMADESAVKLRDLPGLIGCVDSINVKLMKSGGIREAVRMIHFAHAVGMKVMLGCMTETTLSISAAAHLSPMVDYADLDGHLLIANDPYEGLDLKAGRHILSDRPGLGVRPRASSK